MDLFQTIDVASSGMVAQRARLNIIATNLANANTTKTQNGTPYRRKTVIFQTTPMGRRFENHLQNALEQEVQGVNVSGIMPVPGDFRRIFDPGHPDADAQGYVQLPNINLMEEMVNMVSATRSYEANLMAIKATKSMALKALEIGR